MYTPKQLEQLEKHGIEPEAIKHQLENFTNGFPYINLQKPATINDGIIKATDSDLKSWIQTYEEALTKIKVVKFVPASGAATRMFKSLFEFQQRNTAEPIDWNKYPDVKFFFNNITKQAFWNDLNTLASKKNINIQNLLNENKYNEIITLVLSEEGLNYGKLPKGLLKFHSYGNNARTPVEEHLIEALNYSRFNDKVQLHFTVSPEHAQAFDNEVNIIKPKYEAEHKVKIDITYSFQKTSTDTIAVDENNQPLIDKDGLFQFRPGGHGALLSNLNDIDADLIFIKNIDNVAPDYLKDTTYTYKKALAGLLISLKTKINDIISYLEWHDVYPEKKREEIKHVIENELHIQLPDNMDVHVYAEYVKSRLDKPIRICGMVKNEGEPGGGPFWVIGNKGGLSLQVVETSQIDPNSTVQQQILKSATHFNPVDLVCSVKDNNGHKYNLMKYRDPNTGFITEKSISGKKIKAQELPGLWNGSMANWITIFVEVPMATFSPVKTINDLLRKEHQPKA